MNLALDECECGHVALIHDYDVETESLSRCSKCDCQSFSETADQLGPYDHVPN